VFGSLDDFLISSMSSQLDALSFLKEGSTKRKEIFAKFLDLEIFEKKFRFAKNDAGTLSDNKKELGDKASMIDKIISFLADFNIEEVRGRKEESIEVYQKIKILEKELETIDKKIATLEDPGFLKGCKCLNEAEQALKDKPSKDGQLNDLNSHVKELNPEEAEETIDKFNKLGKRKSDLSERILKLNLYIQQDENKIENLERQLDVLHSKRKGYQTNKEAIDNLEGFLTEKRNKEATLKMLQGNLDECQEAIMNLYKVHGSCEEKLNTLVSLQKELDELRQEYSAYDLFMRCMHNNGIAYDVIKKRLPALNEEIAKVLANIVDFEIFFEDDGKRLNIFIKHPSHEPRPLEMGSGAEKTIAAMAIRLALLSVSSLPKGDIFILDEPGTALDADNMEGFVRILDVVKSYFKTVLLITHLDSLKDCVDTQITIDKVDGYAFINQ
jgi:DNA repair exonuclease SbcCD ATPase subunit